MVVYQKPLILAIDFDGTLFQWATFPQVGPPVPYAIGVCKVLQEQGHTLVLWTCRDGIGLDMAIEAMKEQDLEFPHYNFLPDCAHLSVKLNADLFIDDKGFGCPLIYPAEGRPYVDWRAVAKEFGIITHD